MKRNKGGWHGSGVALTYRWVDKAIRLSEWRETAASHSRPHRAMMQTQRMLSHAPIVFALEREAQDQFLAHNLLYCGIDKVNAAAAVFSL